MQDQTKIDASRTAIKEIVRDAFAWPIAPNHWAASWEDFVEAALQRADDGDFRAVDEYEKAIHTIVTPAIAAGLRRRGIPCDDEFIRGDLQDRHTIGSIGEGAWRRPIEVASYDTEDEGSEWYFVLQSQPQIASQWVASAVDYEVDFLMAAAAA